MADLSMRNRNRNSQTRDSLVPSRFQRVQRAAHPRRPAFHHVQIDHRRANVFVAQQILHLLDVVPRFQQVRHEAVTTCGVTRFVNPDCFAAARIAFWSESTCT